ncbi:hypothetical protein ACOMHN_033417 [Nucella lapillus]
MASPDTSSMHYIVQTSAENVSSQSGCMIVRVSEMEFLPWNNPDNIVSEQVEKVSHKVGFVMLQILFLIGGPGNVINMAVFFKQSLKDRVNLLLFSLSLADEIFLVLCMLLTAEEYFWERSGMSPLVKFITNSKILLFWGTCFVSFVLSAIIACERCYCVVRPLKYQTLMTTRTMAFIIVAVYAVILGLRFVIVFRYHVACVYDPDTGIESTVFTHTEFYLRHIDLIDNLDSIFFGAGLPVIIIIVVITTTAITITKLRQAMAWRSETSSTLSPREVALTKMLIGTSVLLIICGIPSCLFRVACVFLPEVNTGGRNHNFYLMCLWVTEIFLYINSSFNIFIYYVMGSRYRETFWSLFKRNTTKTREK